MLQHTSNFCMFKCSDQSMYCWRMLSLGCKVYIILSFVDNSRVKTMRCRVAIQRKVEITKDKLPFHEGHDPSFRYSSPTRN
jgi:hypothetical protein